MSREAPLNPWRRGRAAGRAYYDALDAYRQALGTAEPLPRPELPTNPYPAPTTRSKNAGARKWEEGLAYARNDWEARQRCGGKKPSWTN